MLSLIFHLGTILKDAKDVEAVITALVTHQEKLPSGPEIKLILEDLVELFQSGVITITGVSPDQVKSVAAGIEAGLASWGA